MVYARGGKDGPTKEELANATVDWLKANRPEVLFSKSQGQKGAKGPQERGRGHKEHHREAQAVLSDNDLPLSLPQMSNKVTSPRASRRA